MYVALLADSKWLDEELPSFQQMVVGLIGEHVRVAQVVPEELSQDDSSVFGERIPWAETRFAPLNHYRLWALDKRLSTLGVDLIHALEGGLWLGAALLARRMNVPAIFTANAGRDVPRVETILRLLPESQTAFTATTEPIAQAMRDRLSPSATVRTIPPGVHVGEKVRQRKAGEAICAVISGDGTGDTRYESLIESLAGVVQDHPNAQFFFDGQGSDQSVIWQRARELNLLQNLSMIPRRLGHRELLVRADVLVHPQPLGLSRGLTLQAMAHGMPVLAQNDPWLDYLIDGRTARVVDDPAPGDWRREIDWIIEQPKDALTLGRSARQWTQDHRLASQQIESTLELYRQVAGTPIPFPGS